MFGAQEFAEETNISPETLAMYTAWYNVLVQWNSKINLVAPSTLGSFWGRHALDSYQLIKNIPADAKRILDMGAGAGFPGIAMAIDAMGTNRQIILCEANGKKANFLRAVIRQLSLPARVAQERVEAMSTSANSFDVITARAFAPLSDLLMYSQPLWGQTTLGLFPKGEHWQSEIDVAEKRYRFSYQAAQSQTSPESKILLITNLEKL